MPASEGPGPGSAPSANWLATARATAGLTAFSLLSPAAGLAVEATLAWRFGVSSEIDAYRVSSVIPLFAQQLVLQVLPYIVIPVFAVGRARGDESGAWRDVWRVAAMFLVPTTAFSALGFLFPEPIVTLLAPGFGGEARDLACYLTRWFALSLVPITWCGLVAGILNAHKIFWLPAAVYAIANSALLLAITSHLGGSGAGDLAFGIVCGAVVNAALFTIRLLPLVRDSPTSAAGDGTAAPWLQTVLPLVASAVVSQWSSVILIRVLSELEPGSVATFGYAWRTGLLVVIVPGALSTALFPQLAAAAVERAEPSSIPFRALRIALFLSLPVSIVLVAEREPLFALLFERGQFSADVRVATAALFGVLNVGVPAAVLFLYAQRILYAARRTWSPLIVQLIGIAVLLAAANVAARWGAMGLSVLAVISGWLTALAGVLIIDGGSSLRRLSGYGLQILAISVATVWLGTWPSGALASFAPPGALQSSVALVSGIALSGCLFAAAVLYLKIPEAEQVRSYVVWQARELLGIRFGGGESG